MKDEDRRYFAKALSAFANSAGGLLIFGVDARKVDGVDCAQEARPIADIERFKSEATRASGDQLQPRHDGIVVEVIPSQARPGAGYLLVYVERSERRPHRSEASGQRQYFKRAGDNSFEMEHYDIEDAFRRITAPILDVEMSRYDYELSGSEVTSSIVIKLRNISATTARHPYLHALPGFNVVLSPRSDFAWIEKGVNEGWSSYSGQSEAIIHPGLQRPFARAVIKHRIQNGDLSQIASNKGEMFSINLKWGCENARIRLQEFILRIGDYASPIRF